MELVHELSQYLTRFAHTKRTLRKAMRERRRNLDPRIARHHSERIQSSLFDLPALQQAKTVSLYDALPNEVATLGIAKDLLKAGKRLLYPCVFDDRLHLRQVTDLDELTAIGAFGVREPDPQRCPQVDPSEVDLFVAPGVAFDLFGGRVGFGGGYYDRLLAQKRQDAWAIGLGFDFQVVRSIETDAHDRRMDCIVTNETIYQPRFSQWGSSNEDETRSFAQRLASNGLARGGVLALHGGLGVGKTVFVSGLARALQCQDATASPTFIYCREYQGVASLLHVDAYRLDEVAEADAPFWDELLERGGLVAIEWAERLGDTLPKSAAHLVGEIDDAGLRLWTLWTPLRDQVLLHGDASSS